MSKPMCNLQISIFCWNWLFFAEFVAKMSFKHCQMQNHESTKDLYADVRSSKLFDTHRSPNNSNFCWLQTHKSKTWNKVKPNQVILVVFFNASGLWGGAPGIINWQCATLESDGVGQIRNASYLMVLRELFSSSPMKKADYAKLGHLSGIFVTLRFWGGPRSDAWLVHLQRRVKG